LEAPAGALVIMDAGIATKANIKWLTQQGYRYLVVSRERNRQFDPDQATSILTAANETVQLQRVLNKDETEVRLYCHSAGREAKETAINQRFMTKLEEQLAKISAGLAKPKGHKALDVIQQRIGRIRDKSHGVAQHYDITVVPDQTGALADSIIWTKKPVDGSKLTHPGVYCLRSNELTWDAEKLWRTYITLTDLESVFRAFKSDLGLRPVFHRKDDRVEGHLFITVLAYQLVQIIRQKLQNADLSLSWSRLREILTVQRRVTATFQQRDGRTLHIRKATTAEPLLRQIYDALLLNPTPGDVQKFTS
jgi:transposase